MRYQNILRWNCSPEEEEMILADLKNCERIGRFQCLEEISGGARFRTFIRPRDNFFADVYQDYPAIRFAHEYASSVLQDYWCLTFLDGELIDCHMPDTKEEIEQNARRVWGDDDRTDEAMSFTDKVEMGWQGYLKEMLKYPKAGLVEKAGEIAAVKYCRDTLAGPNIRREDREYLERFENPLEVVSDAWLDEQNADTGEGFDHVLWELRDRQDAEQLYEMKQTM
ncbi:hypothetical protein AALA61_14825 [Oscillospiraceae bacterium 42-9]